MFDQYVKLFHLDWITPWMVEAVVIIAGALLAVLIVCKVMDGLNGESK
jgi:hypothetical protein